jgi:hypothetical protein
MFAALVPYLIPHKHSARDNDSPAPNRKPRRADDGLVAGDSSDEEEEVHYLSPMEESEDEEPMTMHDVYSSYHDECEEQASPMMMVDQELVWPARFNLLAELPLELLFHVLQYLSPRHLLSLRLVLLHSPCHRVSSSSCC